MPRPHVTRGSGLSGTGSSPRRRALPRIPRPTRRRAPRRRAPERVGLQHALREGDPSGPLRGDLGRLRVGGVRAVAVQSRHPASSQNVNGRRCAAREDQASPTLDAPRGVAPRPARVGSRIVAIGSTIHTFTVHLSDVDRGVYDELQLRVARHPSETAPYMLTRVLAYCLEYEEGIGFSEGVAATDEPAVMVRDLTGAPGGVGRGRAPDAARLHTGSMKADRVAIYTHRDPRRSPPVGGQAHPPRRRGAAAQLRARVRRETRGCHRAP